MLGRYDSERNSWIEGGDIRHVVSGHHTERAAWIASEKAHRDLGGCDGSDSLATVMQKFARVGSRKAKPIVEDQYTPDWYEHAGWIYVGCDFWAAHQIVPAVSMGSASSYGLQAYGLGVAGNDE